MLKSQMRSENPRAMVTEINVTPLVDVCLVLVIIFMVTTAMFLQPPFEIKLPKAHTAEQTKEENLFVAIAPDGQLAVNETKVSIPQFQALIKEKIRQSRHKLVVIRADEKAKSGVVIDTLNVVKQAGARRITFGTDSKAE
ncbi:MAG: biopolymer transporter ExbD [Candidatus Firestonebacteria bacterium]|nr:biopolymer transporter ExbD [Candidatus Firestonebacteria bacterium]